MRLAENTGRKNDAKIRLFRHLGIIEQLCRAVSSQLRHYINNRKNLVNSNIPPHIPKIWRTSTHWRLISFREF